MKEGHVFVRVTRQKTHPQRPEQAWKTEGKSGGGEFSGG